MKRFNKLIGINERTIRLEIRQFPQLRRIMSRALCISSTTSGLQRLQDFSNPKLLNKGNQSRYVISVFSGGGEFQMPFYSHLQENDLQMTLLVIYIKILIYPFKLFT